MILIFSYLLTINIISFILMYVDKRRAILKKWRIKESTFFMLSILGGSLGSFFGMYTFRHKTKHIKFKYGIPLIILVQIIIVYFAFIK